MTTDPEPSSDQVLHVDDDRLRRTSARLDQLSRDLADLADPREPDVGQRRLVEGRLALPVAQPARHLAGLLGALAEALAAAARGATRADGDAAAVGLLLLGELS